ncbi:hypothetical protein IV203_009988 [Nitzschia inconspicua]|uniref:Uncharacterized protein n=1 Tax=Nitzschia inconspicua TaxID=303405 RepID=A0A9K3KWU0_9STRA|nr:hypothetical protein IV203_009988 [Nitzschia inconspicua]
MGRHSHHNRHGDEHDKEVTHTTSKETKREKYREDDKKDQRKGRSKGERGRHRSRHGDDDDESSRNKRRDENRKDEREERERKKRKHGHKSRHRHQDGEGDNSDSETTTEQPKRHRKKSEKKEKKSSSKHRHERDRSRSDDDDDRRIKKKSRHSKHRSKKETVKRPDKSNLFPMGEAVGSPPSTLIDAEKDYYSYHQEFWIYLFREEGVAFNDLDTKHAKKAFSRFAKRYNQGDLEEPYYSRKFPAQVLEETKTSKHSWSFNTSEKERQSLELLQAGVRRQTEYDNNNTSKQQVVLSSITDASQGKSHVTNPLGNIDESADRRRQKTLEERLEDRRANKRLRETVRTAEEELSGGPRDLRERQMEKKREHAARIHGASRDKEDGGAGVELSDSALFGDEERSSFETALARERSNRLRQEKKKQSRIDELQSKEDERQQNMLKMLGLDNLKGQKIKIAPRKDG